MFVAASEAGRAGGWDVYDGINAETLTEVSFYGFSVTDRTKARLLKRSV
jgi:hypothetical protein